MNSVYERDHVLVEIGDDGMTDDVISIGHNFEAVLADLETRMREAAADLNFEEAARLRDEVKRLRATELAVVDDPTAKQRTVQDQAGAYAGTKKYGDAANLPAAALKGRGGSAAAQAAAAVPPPPLPVLHGERAGVRGSLHGVHGVRNPNATPAPVHGRSLSDKRQLQSPQAPSRRNARPGIPALPPEPRAARKTPPGGGSQDLPAHRLAPIRPGVRPRAALDRRRAGASGWVEEAVGRRF